MKHEHASHNESKSLPDRNDIVEATDRNNMQLKPISWQSYQGYDVVPQSDDKYSGSNVRLAKEGKLGARVSANKPGQHCNNGYVRREARIYY